LATVTFLLPTLNEEITTRLLAGGL